MNGYFQLEVQSEGVFVKIYPPTEGGEAVNIKELMDYCLLYTSPSPRD